DKDGPPGDIGTNGTPSRPQYDLETLDQPESLITNLGESFGSVKTMSVHAIVTNNEACRVQQNSQGAGIKGYIGSTYMALASPSDELRSKGNIVDGVVGSICSENYTSHLGSIAAKINQNVNVVQLVCQPAVIEGQNSLVVEFETDPGFAIDFSVDTDNRL